MALAAAKLENVWKTYRMGEETVNALRGASLEIKKGEFFAIQGPSGSGKSTAMHIIGALDAPDRGSVYIQGREFRKGEKKAAIVGNSYSTDEKLMGRAIKPGDTVRVEGEEFKVIGVRRKLGDPANDVSVIIPIETAWEIYGNKDEYALISAEVEEGFRPADVAARIKDDLRRDRDQEEGDEDFQVQTSEDLSASFTSILSIVQAVIIGIAAISLVVGSIGVMNTMYTTVLERTREIGIMKAVGAKNRDVMLLFLIESGLYGLVGGLVGIAFGLGMGKMVEFAATNFLGSELLKASTSPALILGALAFSFILGCVSGVAPARQAARLRPVQALRYE